MVPTTTRGVVFTAPGQVTISDFPLPEMADDQVLVQVKACAICTWEQRFFRGLKPDDYPFRGGHELSGVVVARGARAQCGSRVGDTVTVALLDRCGQCYYCERGMDNLCERARSRPGPGQIWGPGGLSEYVVVQDYQVFQVPGDIADYAQIALTEPLACVVHSVGRGKLSLGDTALVQGAGIMGVLHLWLLNRLGKRVVVAEPDPVRRAQALAWGATAAVDPLTEDLVEVTRRLTDGRGVEAAFFTAGGASAIQTAVRCLAKGGWLALYGYVGSDQQIQLVPNLIHYSELTITGTFSQTRDSFRQALALISGRLLDLSPLISERLPFAEVDRAMARAISPDTYRVVVTF